MKGFKLEQSVIVSFVEIQKTLYFIIKDSKFTMGELAKKLKMNRATFSNKFKELNWSAVELNDLINLLDKEFFPNLPEDDNNKTD